MGWYADTAWQVEFPSQEAVAATMAELADEAAWEFTGGNSNGEWMWNVGEGSEEYWSEDRLRLEASTWEKCFVDDKAFAIFARRATGTVHVTPTSGSDDQPYRIDLKDGEARVVVGRVVYLDGADQRAKEVLSRLEDGADDLSLDEQIEALKEALFGLLTAVSG